MSQSDLNSIFLSPDCQDAGHRRGWLGIAEYIWSVAQSNNLQAAKPADALGSLPVVAFMHKDSRCLFPIHKEAGFLVEHYAPLTDHAQATAEIAKNKERFRVAMVDVEVSREIIRIRDMDIANLVEALKSAQATINTMKNEAEVGIHGDECMIHDAFANISNQGLDADTKIRKALATYESAQ